MFDKTRKIYNLKINFPLQTVGWCLHLCSEIQNQSPYPNHDSQAWADPVCPYAMINTLYLFSEHTISIIINNKCSKIYTASSACLNDWTTNTIDFIFRIFKLNKNIFFCILAIHHTQDQIILALRATDHDEVVAALYLVATRQEKARPSPESVGSITSRYSGNDPTLHSRRGGTRQTQESGGKFEPIESVQNVA